jgi:diguanylate cyclase
MITAIFLIGILNLGLGFAISVLADGPWQLPIPKLFRERGSAPETEPEVETPQVEVPEDPGDQKDEWLAILRRAEIEPESDVESVLWLAYLELPFLRASIMPVDKSWRTATEPELKCDYLAAEGTTWLGKLESWAAALIPHKDDAELEKVAQRFEGLLLDQHFKAKSAQESLLQLAANSQESGTEISQELAALFNSFDTVSDFVSEELANLLRDDQRFDPLNERQQDLASGTISRLGLEVLFRDWWLDDPEGRKVISCVLVDIDKTARLNESQGADITDRLLAAFGRLLSELIRVNRGYDRIARHDGQSYLLFLGDTDLSSAASGAERIRQTVEVSSFQVEDQATEVTASFGVAQMGRRETLSEFLERLRQGVAEAKKAGRDRTFVDDGRGPTAVTLPQYEVVRREIQVELS